MKDWKNSLSLAMALGVLLICSIPLPAQTDPAATKRVPPDPQMHRGPRRENEVHQLIEALYISRLQEDLNLTDEQYASVIPAVKNFLRVRHSGARLKNQRERELSLMLNQGAPNEQVQAKLNELDQLKKQIEKDVETAQNAVNAKLDVNQRARFHQYQQKIDQRINRMIQQIREGRRMQRMQGNPPSADEKKGPPPSPPKRQPPNPD
jgi:small-conductance mechanosensitive channel